MNGVEDCALPKRLGVAVDVEAGAEVPGVLNVDILKGCFYRGSRMTSIDRK